MIQKKVTEELAAEIKEAHHIEDYLANNKDELVDKSLAQLLNEAMESCGKQKKDIIRDAGLEQGYGYQIFSGEREKPSRDRVLALLLAMPLELEAAVRLLRRAGIAQFDPRNRRDAVLIAAFDKGMSVMKTNQKLDGVGCKPLDGTIDGSGLRK